jgi:protein TonB
MRNFLFYEKSFFVPALVVSAAVHGLLIGAGGWISSAPDAAVLQAPSSLEVTVVNHPVVSILEKEIVSEEIIEGNILPEVVFKSPPQQSFTEKKMQPSLASVESRGAVTKAQPLAHMNPAPPYPRLARQRGWEGIVRLEVLVGKDGVPGRVAIEKSSGYAVLDEAAAKTVGQWKFSPARSGPVRFLSKITVPIQFALIQGE